MGKSQAPVNSDLDHFFQAAFSIDLVLFTYTKGRIRLLLVKKEESIYKGNLGLPGMLIYPNEDTDESLNELSLQLLGTKDFYKKQLRAFSEVGRHPQGRVITIAYYGLISEEKIFSDDGLSTMWHDIDELPELSYDHNRIVEVARHKFSKGLLRHSTVFELLPEQFILSEMIQIYEQAFGRKVDSPNFRRRARESGLISPIGEKRKGKGQMGRRPQLYTYDREKSRSQIKETIGFNVQVS